MSNHKSEWIGNGAGVNAFLQTLEIGDLIEFKRTMYNHWGLYIGTLNGKQHQIVHRNNPDDSGSIISTISASATNAPINKGGIVVEDLLAVVAGDLMRVNNSLDDKYRPFPPDEIRSRALARKDHASAERADDQYNVIFSNCEHFVVWCRYGKNLSSQVEEAKELGKKILTAIGETVVDWVASDRNRAQ